MILHVCNQREKGVHSLRLQLDKVTMTMATPPLHFFFFLPFSWATPLAYGGSQAGGLAGAVAAGLCHSHSNSGSEPCLQPTPQLMAMLDS